VRLFLLIFTFAKSSKTFDLLRRKTFRFHATGGGRFPWSTRRYFSCSHLGKVREKIGLTIIRNGAPLNYVTRIVFSIEFIDQDAILVNYEDYH